MVFRNQINPHFKRKNKHRKSDQRFVTFCSNQTGKSSLTRSWKSRSCRSFAAKGLCLQNTLQFPFRKHHPHHTHFHNHWPILRFGLLLFCCCCLIPIFCCLFSVLKLPETRAGVRPGIIKKKPKENTFPTNIFQTKRVDSKFFYERKHTKNSNHKRKRGKTSTVGEIRRKSGNSSRQWAALLLLLWLSSFSPSVLNALL